MRIGPVLEVTTSFQYGKHGIEIRIWSVGQDNSQSWVGISYGTNEYVIDSNQNNTEILADPHEDQTSQTSIKVVCSQIKGKSKTTTEGTCFNSGGFNFIFEFNSHKYSIGLMIVGKLVWSVRRRIQTKILVLL